MITTWSFTKYQNSFLKIFTKVITVIEQLHSQRCYMLNRIMILLAPFTMKPFNCKNFTCESWNAAAINIHSIEYYIVKFQFWIYFTNFNYFEQFFLRKHCPPFRHELILIGHNAIGTIFVVVVVIVVIVVVVIVVAGVIVVVIVVVNVVVSVVDDSFTELISQIGP